MVISRGDVWWAELGDPVGSGPGYRRPVVVVQGDSLNRSAIATVANVSQILTLDKELLTERTGKLPEAKLDLLLAGIDVVLGRS